MFRDEEEIEELMRKIADIMNPHALASLHSHMASLHRKVEDLKKSRDKWRIKYETVIEWKKHNGNTT